MMTVRSISGRPVRGSVEPRELVEHAGHLVAALAAAQVDDDVGVAALGQRFEQHRLAGAEAAGDRRLAALRHREQAVEDALAGDQRRARRQPARAPAAARAPARRGSSRARAARPSAVAQRADGRVVGVLAGAPRPRRRSPLDVGRREAALRAARPAALRLADDRAAGAARRPRATRGANANAPRAGARACPAATKARVRARQRPQQAVEDVAEQRRARARIASGCAVAVRPRCPGAGRSCPRRPARRSRRRRCAPPRRAAPAGRRAPPRAARTGPRVAARSTGPLIQRTMARLIGLPAASQVLGSRSSSRAPIVAAVGQQAVERAVDRRCRRPRSSARRAMRGVGARSAGAAPSARGELAAQRLLLGRRPVGRDARCATAPRGSARARCGDAPCATQAARAAGVAPASQQRVRQPLPGPPQQRRGALLLVQPALRRQLAPRGGDALAARARSLGEGLAHARARLGVRLRAQRGGARAGPRRGSRRTGARGRPRPGRAAPASSRLRASRVMPRAPVARAAAPPGPAAARSPCRSGTISDQRRQRRQRGAQRGARRCARRTRGDSSTSGACARARPARPPLAGRRRAHDARRRAGSRPR